MGQQSEGKITVKCRVNFVADIFAVCGHILFCRVPIVQLCISASVIEPNQVDPMTPVAVCVIFTQPKSMWCIFLFLQGFVCYTGSCSEHVLLVFSCPPVPWRAQIQCCCCFFQCRTATTELRSCCQWRFTWSALWLWLLRSSWWEQRVKLFCFSFFFFLNCSKKEILVKCRSMKSVSWHCMSETEKEWAWAIAALPGTGFASLSDVVASSFQLSGLQLCNHNARWKPASRK